MSYQEIRDNLLKVNENAPLKNGTGSLHVTKDGGDPEHPVIGYGYDLPAHWNSVQSDLDPYLADGVSVTDWQKEVLRSFVENDEIENPYDDGDQHDVNSSLIGKVATLSDVLTEWDNISLASEQAATELLDDTVQPFEDGLDGALGNSKGNIDDRERAAIISSIYNLSGSSAESIEGHIPKTLEIIENNEGDPTQRAKLWYELKFNTNKPDENGQRSHSIQNRRDREAATLSLYGNGTSPSSIKEAKAVLFVLNSRRDTIKRYLGEIDQGGYNLKTELDPFLSGSKTLLVNEYAEGREIDSVLVGATTSYEDYDGQQLDIDDTLQGTDQNDLILGQDGTDSLQGQGGADYLVGGAGNDHLQGGAGSDNYLFSTDTFSSTNPSVDVINDSDGSGQIKIAGADFVVGERQSLNTWASANGQFLVAADLSRNSQTLVIIDKNTASKILIKNWHNGDLGIQLGGDIPTPTVAALTADNDLFGANGVVGLNGFGAASYYAAYTKLPSYKAPLIRFNSLGLTGDNNGDDAYAGLAGSDGLGGGAGNDTLKGGADNDLILGGSGDDRLYGGDGIDYIIDGSSDTHFEQWSDPGAVQDTIDQLGSAVESVGKGWYVYYEQLPGGGLAHTIKTAGTTMALDPDQAPSGDDFISGGEGADWIWAGQGDDEVSGGAGNDFIEGGADDDVIHGGDNNDVIRGDFEAGRDTDTSFWHFGVSAVANTNGNDLIHAGSGDDDAAGDGGNDVIFGGDGDDTLVGNGTTADSGAPDADYIDGGAGADSILGDGGNDQLLGGAGNDKVYGDSANTALWGDDMLV